MNIKKKTLVDLVYMTDLIADRLAYHTKAIVVKTDKIIEIAGLRILNDYDKHENAVCAIVTDTEGIEYPIGEIMPYLRSLNKMTPGEMERFLHYQRLGSRDEMEYFYKQVHLDNKTISKTDMLSSMTRHTLEDTKQICSHDGRTDRIAQA